MSRHERVDAVEGVHGEVLQVGVFGGLVLLSALGTTEVKLGAEAQEQFAQAYVAACRKAEANRAAESSGSSR